MKKLFPDAVISYDLAGVKTLEYFATFQGEEAEQVAALIREHYETDDCDRLISLAIDCASCLDAGEIVSLDSLRGLRGDWLRLQWGTGGDYVIFKQLGLDLYSFYRVID